MNGAPDKANHLVRAEDAAERPALPFSIFNLPLNVTTCHSPEPLAPWRLYMNSLTLNVSGSVDPVDKINVHKKLLGYE